MTPGSPKEQEDDAANLPEEPELSDEQKLDLLKETLVYDYDKHMLDFRKMKATDLKDCPKLHLPPSRPQAEKVEFHTKEHMWTMKYCEYMMKHCTENGRQKIDNMTKQERRGFYNS